jgi:hypothetical protein
MALLREVLQQDEQLPNGSEVEAAAGASSAGAAIKSNEEHDERQPCGATSRSKKKTIKANVSQSRQHEEQQNHARRDEDVAEQVPASAVETVAPGNATVRSSGGHGGVQNSQQRQEIGGESTNEDDDEDAMLARLLAGSAGLHTGRTKLNQAQQYRGQHLGSQIQAPASSTDGLEQGLPESTEHDLAAGGRGSTSDEEWLRGMSGSRRNVGKGGKKGTKPSARASNASIGAPASCRTVKVGHDGSSDKKSSKQKRHAALDSQADNATALETGLSACAICGANFVSRTQLFKHIKESGHAALKG